MPFGRRSSNGRATACRRIRAPGWCRPAASRPSTAYAAARASTAIEDVAEQVDAVVDETPEPWDGEDIEDDRLRLIFTCCHPALSPDAQVALTLREVCGLTTEEIAQAFLSRRIHAGAAHRARQGERSATPASPTKCRRRTSCRSGSTACCA